MRKSSAKATYSGRARLLAVFVALALILGGGGTPNPATELILEVLFVVVALAWLWLRGGTPERSGSTDRLAYALVAVVLVIPVLQLVPLPASLWTGLPGRENAIAALSLIGEQTTWRPISLSPTRTLAALLAILPPLFCFYAVARLALHERRLVLWAVVLVAVISSLLGAVQLTSPGQGISFYREHHVGWVIGFQANRNAEADVLLISLLALSVLAAPYLLGAWQRRPLRLERRPFALLVAAIGLLLLAATVMTGSRTGILLVIVMAAGVLLIGLATRAAAGASPMIWKIAAACAGGAVLLALAFVFLSHSTAVGRVAQRFSEFGSSRAVTWEDAWFALKQYWPVGFGLGGFMPAMLPAERLEVLGPELPNRAHNDFLELGLEAGLLGYVMLAIAVVLCLLLAWRAWRHSPATRPQVVFGLSVLIIIALHSVVDYPLRSMAVASLAGVAGGMLVRNRASAHRGAALLVPENIEGSV